MEGAETEPRYFNEFRTPREADLQIKLVPNPKHRSAPKEVFQRLTRFFSKGYSTGRDQGWIVIDRDAWTEEELNQVSLAAQESGLQVALSNPCFELWLYLHLRDSRPFNDRHACQSGLAAELPNYQPDNKGSYDAAAILSSVDQAIRRAEITDNTQHAAWPHQQGTRVYKLVKILLSGSPPRAEPVQ